MARTFQPTAASTRSAVIETTASTLKALNLKAVTYNLLADKYAVSGFHSYCPSRWLEWAYRLPRILRELDDYDADLICLQEVEFTSWEMELLPHFTERGFKGLYYGRRVKASDAVLGGEEGCALLWRTARLQLQHSKTVRFGDHTPEEDDSSFWAAVKEREDGAVLAVLRDVVSGRSMLAASTHLFWDPAYPDIKAAQAHILCHEMRAFADVQWLSRPVVLLGGDFNSLWRKYTSDAFDEVPQGGHLTSGVYQLLSTGTLAADHHDHPSQRRPEESALEQVVLSSAGLQLHSVHMLGCGQEPPLTTKTAHFAGCLDYLWVSAGDWTVTALLDLPYPGSTGPDPQGTELGTLPNENFPSDHLAVGAVVTPVGL